MPDLNQISNEIGINLNYLQGLAILADKFYKTYFIKKKSGKNRTITSPNYQLKAIQGWFLRKYLDPVPLNDRVTGFVKKKGIKTNGVYHLDNKIVMCLDLENFFPSITSAMINNYFLTRFDEITSGYLTKLVTYRGILPQGGVTSPALSNIIFHPIDDEITNLCNEKNITYSRYADDLTFSSNYIDDLVQLKSQIMIILNKSGFQLNEHKTRFMTGKNRKIVTGLILNSGKLTVGKLRKRFIRAALFNYIIKKDKSVNVNEIYGLIAFIRDIEPDYAEKIQNYIIKLKSKEEFLNN